MKKVLEINVDDQNSGGVFSIVRNVIENNDTGIKIDIAAIEKFENSDNIKNLKRYNCEVFYVGYEGNKWKKQLRVYNNLKSFLKKNKYDAVHIHADTANKLFVSGIAAKHAGVPNIILHSHSSGVEGNGKVKIIVHDFCRLYLKNIGTKFVACSQLAAKWMYPNISERKIILVKNGVPLSKFVYDETIRLRWRRELGVKSNEVVIGHVGRLMAPKNHEFLIDIVKYMKNQGSAVKLLIIGEGYKESELKSYTRKLCLENEVIFFGTSNKVYELLMAVDIFCLPSFFEGLPIVGIEAQAAGLPVIYSDRVTPEAKILDNVEYLPIQMRDIPEWAEHIIAMTKRNRRNYESNFAVRKSGFDITDTVKAFTNLYI